MALLSQAVASHCLGLPLIVTQIDDPWGLDEDIHHCPQPVLFISLPLFLRPFLLIPINLNPSLLTSY